eukprot:8010656-Pyramimonas_sp.AAC.1
MDGRGSLATDRMDGQGSLATDRMDGRGSLATDRMYGRGSLAQRKLALLLLGVEAGETRLSETAGWVQYTTNLLQRVCFVRVRQST